MDLRDLRYFEVIAELEHLGRAGEILHRSQPALTSCIRRLEEQYRTPLFERAGRGIRRTPAGSMLLKWAKEIRLIAERASRELSDHSHGLSGPIRIGVIPTAAHFLLPPVLKVFLAEAPKVTVQTVVGRQEELQASLREGALDLMIGSTAVDGLASQVIVTDEIVVVGCDSHPIFDTRPTMKALSGYDWVLQDRTAITRQWLDQAFESRGLPRPRVQVQTNFVLQLPLLVADTGLLSFVSRQHLFPGRPWAPLKEVRLRTTTMRRPLMAILKLEAEPAPAVQRLIELLGTLGGSMFQQRRDPAKKKAALPPRRGPAPKSRKAKSSPHRNG